MSEEFIGSYLKQKLIKEFVFNLLYYNFNNCDKITNLLIRFKICHKFTCIEIIFVFRDVR